MMNPVKKRWLWAGAGIALAIVVLAVWQSLPGQPDTPLVPLFSYELTEQQRVEVESYLKQHGHTYEVQEGTVLVEEARQSDILVNMARAGVPSRP